MVAKSEITMRVKELREEKGLSRVALAEAVGTSPQTIWNIEEQGSVPLLSLALRLARALGVSVEELLKEE
jgi:putative transcriptional regulator